jgi:hypothetical protein
MGHIRGDAIVPMQVSDASGLLLYITQWTLLLLLTKLLAAAV